MSDISKVCALCDFYDELSMDCERFPPSVKEKYKDDNGDDCAYWDQPYINHPWTTRCGEWREKTDPVEDTNHPEHAAAVARLTLIVAKQRKQKEEDGNRD